MWDVIWRISLLCFLILAPAVTFRWHCSAENSDAIQNKLAISKLKPFFNVLESKHNEDWNMVNVIFSFMVSLSALTILDSSVPHLEMKQWNVIKKFRLHTFSFCKNNLNRMSPPTCYWTFKTFNFYSEISSVLNDIQFRWKIFYRYNKNNYKTKIFRKLFFSVLLWTVIIQWSVYCFCYECLRDFLLPRHITQTYDRYIK